MTRFFLVFFAVLSISLSNSPAHAGLFDDEEARKAISDLRARITAFSDTKADKVAILEQIKQLDSLRDEVARLRGQVEVLTNEVSDNQRRQKEGQNSRNSYGGGRRQACSR